jgi:flagellar motor component MotA
MPAGLGWGQYISFVTAALTLTFLGSQATHMIFKPLADLDDCVAKRKLELIEEKKLQSSNKTTNDL